jgi:hypothetical protein
MVEPDWGSRKVAEIMPEDVDRLLAKVALCRILSIIPSELVEDGGGGAGSARTEHARKSEKDGCDRQGYSWRKHLVSKEQPS